MPTIALSLMTVVSAVAGLNMALPKLAVATGATQTELTWIVDSYTVVFSGLLLIAGAIGDRFGRQRALFIGLAIFAASSLFGFFQTEASGLIAARMIMGIGAALIMPSTLSVITTSFPPESRAKAVSAWVGIAGGGAVLGLFGVAILLKYLDWNSFFLFNLTMATLALLGCLRVPNSRDENGHALDWLGGALSILTVGGFVFGIIEGPDKGWDAPETVTGLVVGSLALVAFVVAERRAKYPLLDPRLFRLRSFTAGSLSITLQFFGQFGFIFVGMQYLQFVAGFEPLDAAAHLLWLPLVVLPGSRLAGVLAKRIPQKYLGSVGLAIFGFALLHFSRLGVQFDYWYFTTGILLFGLGMALSATPATVAITSALPSEKQGVASAVNDTARELGSALGIAILGAALTDAYKSAMKIATDGLPASLAEKLQGSVAFTQMQKPAQLPPVIDWNKLVADGLSAFQSGVSAALNIAGWVAIGGALIILILAPRKIAEVH
jgi:EmrB/QacA subfamily drug resistance transporter